jgi:hypothetical protein
MLLAPVDRRYIPHLTRELSRACGTGYPSLQVFASLNGFMLAGVAPDLTPGLMAMLGVSSHSGLYRTSRSNLHIPLRLGLLGPTSPGSHTQEWSLASGLVDTDVAIIITSHHATLANLRLALSFFGPPASHHASRRSLPG